MTLDGLIAFGQHLLVMLNGSDSMFWDHFILIFTNGLTWVPLLFTLFLLVMKNNETMVQIGLVVGCVLLGVFLSGGINGMIIKPLVARLRPCDDPMLKYTVDVVNNYRASGFSFFSNHAANTMAIAVFMMWLVRSRLLSLTLFSWSVLNGWSRVYLAQHYPSDVLVGWLWGAMMGSLAYLVFYRLYNKVSPPVNYISSQYTTTGYSNVDIHNVMLVLMLTLCVAVICALFTMTGSY